MRKTWLLLTAIMMIALAACTSAGEAASVTNGEGSASGETAEGRELQGDFNDALSIQSQLAVGTLLLEETDLAVDEALAAELYPLWQVIQSLSSSDTAAEVEVQAVVNQIQNTMRPEQIAAIAELQLTAEGLTTMLEDGTLAFGGGGFGRGSGGDGVEGGAGRPAGGFGGGPGGGIPGGGRPGGGPGEGAFPGGLDPDAIATRQAEFAGGDTGSFQERAMVGAVVRMLGAKTGELAAEQPVRQFQVVFDAVAAATGLSIEDIQAQMAEGTTLAEIVEASGTDLDAVYGALVLALGELPNAEELDIELLASQWLGLEE